MRRLALLAAATFAAAGGGAMAQEARDSSRVAIVTSDVDRFFALYDDPALAADPDALAARYLATPSPGLVEFMALRRITPDRLAAALRAKPAVYRDARGCAAKLDKVRDRPARGALSEGGLPADHHRHRPRVERGNSECEGALYRPRNAVRGEIHRGRRRGSHGTCHRARICACAAAARAGR